MKIVIEIDEGQSFMINGYQTGEIFEWQEWYQKGLTPQEAVDLNFITYN